MYDWAASTEILMDVAQEQNAADADDDDCGCA